MTQQLIDACFRNDIETAKRLIKSGVNLDFKSISGWTALMHAVHLNSELTTILIDHGANLDLQDFNGLTALMHLSYPDHQAELLIAHGADINIVDYRGETALMHAAKKNNISAVRLFLEKGMQVDQISAEGETALFFAGMKGFFKVADILIDAGDNVLAVPNHQDPIGQTLLMEAAFEGKHDFVEYLIRKGANVHLTNYYGRTALIECHEDIVQNEQCIELLIKHGADINAQDTFGHTLLHVAAENLFLNSNVEYLIKKGADFEIKNYVGVSAKDILKEHAQDNNQYAVSLLKLCDVMDEKNRLSQIVDDFLAVPEDKPMGI